jgi:hypothetical protein
LKGGGTACASSSNSMYTRARLCFHSCISLSCAGYNRV